MRKYVTSMLLVAGLAWSGAAQAGFVCASGTSAALSGTSGCELGSVNNDLLNPLQVNIDNMFGFTDWLIAQKDNDLDGTDDTLIDLGLTITGGTISGTWAINDIWSTFSDVMLVFKGGGGNTSPDHYVGYLLSAGNTVGSYFSPFVNSNNGNPINISHASIYVRGDSTTSVSEPGILAIFSAGILALGLFGRRRKRN